MVLKSVLKLEHNNELRLSDIRSTTAPIEQGLVNPPKQKPKTVALKISPSTASPAICQPLAWWTSQSLSTPRSIMTSKHLRLVLAWLALRLCSATTNEDDARLLRLLTSARRHDSALFSGTFAGVTVFGCSRGNGPGGLELLRGLSRAFVAGSVIDAEEGRQRLAELAWLDADFCD